MYHLGESIDYAESQCLITSVIEELEGDRNDKAFRTIYYNVLHFVDKYGIDISQKSKHRQSKTIPNRFKNAFLTSTIGHRKDIESEVDYRYNIYYLMLDAILVEMRDRFSPSNIALLSSVASLSPQNNSF